MLAHVSVPFLFIYGGKDDDGPPIATSVARVIAARATIGARDAIDIFPSAGHDLRIESGTGSRDFPRFAPGYLTELASWVASTTR